MSVAGLNFAGIGCCILIMFASLGAKADVNGAPGGQVLPTSEIAGSPVVEETDDFVEEVKDGLATADLSVGEIVYEDNCAACHGYDGVNMLPEAPDFTGAEIFKKTNTELFRSVRDGRGDIMPPWSEELSVAEMFAALAFAKQFAPKKEDGTVAVEE